MRKLTKGKKAYTSMPVQIKGIDKEAHRLTMVASTQSPDRHGDTVLQAGWDIKMFKKNPVILNSHNYDDATEVIARAEKTRIEGKGKKAKLVQEWVFAVEENPKAKIIFDLYAGGFLHASSVGFIPTKFAEKEDGSRDWYTIEEAELLEVSAVSVPANAEATLAKSLGIDVKELREAVKFTEPEPKPEEEDDEDEPEAPDDSETEPEEEETTEDEETPEEEEAEEEEPETTEEPEEEPEEKKVSPKRRYLKAIDSINQKQADAYKQVSKILQSILEQDPDGPRLDRDTQKKVHSRKINKAIRILVKNK